MNDSSRRSFEPPEFENVAAFLSPRWHELLSAVWLCVVFVGGVLLNGFTLLVFIWNKRLVTGSNIYVITLLLNDFTLCSLALGMPLVAEFSGHWLSLMNMSSCIAEAFIVYLFGLASMFVLVAIAISRYVAITGSSLTADDNKRKAISAVALCECLALAFAVAPLFGWGSYGLEAHGTSCGLAWRDRSGSAYSYLITITIACFVLPVAIMMYCYIRIYHNVSTSPRIRVAVAAGQSRRERKEKYLLKLSVAFVLTFLLSWTPYAFVSFYVIYGKPERLDPMLSRSAALVAKSQVLWNPILYFLIAKGFRREVIAMLPCKCKARANTMMATFVLNTQTARITRLDKTTAIQNDRHDSSKLEENKTAAEKGTGHENKTHISAERLEHFRNRHKETSENYHASTIITEDTESIYTTKIEIHSENIRTSKMKHTEKTNTSEKATKHTQSISVSETVIKHSENVHTTKIVIMQTEKISTSETTTEQ